MAKGLISPCALNHRQQPVLCRARGNPSLASLAVSFLTVSGCVSSLVSSSLFPAGGLVAALRRIVSPLSCPDALCCYCNGPVKVCRAVDGALSPFNTLCNMTEAPELKEEYGMYVLFSFCLCSNCFKTKLFNFVGMLQIKKLIHEQYKYTCSGMASSLWWLTIAHFR